MNIAILHLLDGAAQARGLTVIIDVFRAFSTACYLYANNAEKIIPVTTVEEAFELKKTLGNTVLLGEVGGKVIPGFDFDNSPAHIENENFTGKTVIHRSSSGTQGLIAAQQATEVITGSLVNAGAIVRYIQLRQPAEVSLVCMGWSCQYATEEDNLCAGYIKACLEGRVFPLDASIAALKETAGKRFFLPENQQSEPQRDFYLCTRVSPFPFILKRCFEAASGHYYLESVAVDIPAC